LAGIDLDADVGPEGEAATAGLAQGKPQVGIGVAAGDVVADAGAGHRLWEAVDELVAEVLTALGVEELLLGHPPACRFRHWSASVVGDYKPRGERGRREVVFGPWRMQRHGASACIGVHLRLNFLACLSRRAKA
jgi:hypothetical protein